VMLVLLIMFLIAIPAATHKVPVTLPAEGTGGPAGVSHDLDILPDGALRWDGAPIAATALPGRLAAFARDPDAPLLRVRADGAARYETVDELLAQIARARIERVGFVGHHEFAGHL